MNKDETREAAEILRRFIARIEDGTLDPPTPRETAILRRIEGGAIVLETLSGKRSAAD